MCEFLLNSEEFPKANQNQFCLREIRGNILWWWSLFYFPRWFPGGNRSRVYQGTKSGLRPSKRTSNYPGENHERGSDFKDNESHGWFEIKNKNCQNCPRWQLHMQCPPFPFHLRIDLYRISNISDPSKKVMTSSMRRMIWKLTYVSIVSMVK